MAANERDKLGRTELHYTAVDLHPDRHAAETLSLIRRGFNPNAQDQNGWTPLHFAAQERSVACARVLIDNGAEVDAVDRDGNTPLGRAVFSSAGEGELIALLLSAGADADKENYHGVSPRSLAASIANFDVACHFEDA